MYAKVSEVKKKSSQFISKPVAIIQKNRVNIVTTPISKAPNNIRNTITSTGKTIKVKTTTSGKMTSNNKSASKEATSKKYVSNRLIDLSKPKRQIEVKSINNKAVTQALPQTQPTLKPNSKIIEHVTTKKTFIIQSKATAIDSIKPQLKQQNETVHNERTQGRALMSRIWNRNPPPPSRPNSLIEDKTLNKVESIRTFDELGIQANEAEIINHSLLVGDIKIINPSAKIIALVEKNRKDQKTKELLNTTRKFEGPFEKEGEHITDLNEFLERSYITKKPRKPRDLFEKDKRLFSSLDKLLNRAVPKTESITNIKERIKRKEQELFSLFDNVQNIKNFSNINQHNVNQ